LARDRSSSCQLPKRRHVFTSRGIIVRTRHSIVIQSQGKAELENQFDDDVLKNVDDNHAENNRNPEIASSCLARDFLRSKRHVRIERNYRNAIVVKRSPIVIVRNGMQRLPLRRDK